MVEGLAVAEQRFTAKGAKQYILRYLYDENNSPIGFGIYYPTASSPYWQYYYFGKNLQGDVVALYRCDYKSSDKSYYPTLVATYTYDPWGAPTGIYDANGNTISQTSHAVAAYNPFRYRGYRYDGDTRLYYLQSRYYDPAIGRFVNADVYASTGQGFIGCNMFAYCINNPVNARDSAGTFAIVDDIAVAFVFLCVLVYAEYVLSPQGQQAAAEVAQGMSTYINDITKGSLIQTQETVDQSLASQAKAKIERSYAKTTTRSYGNETEVHHIVAQRAPAAAPARLILEKVGIGINDALNTVPLKKSLHRRLHTNAYYMWVNYAITNAYHAPGNKKANVTKALLRIRYTLHSWECFAP